MNYSPKATAENANWRLCKVPHFTFILLIQLHTPSVLPLKRVEPSGSLNLNLKREIREIREIWGFELQTNLISKK